MKNKIERKTRIMPLIGIFSGFFLLALVTTYFYSPVKKSFADSQYANTSFKIRIAPALSLSAVDDVIFNFNNTTNGEFQSKSASVVVTANMPLGYDLYFSTVDKGTSLVNPKSPTQIVSNFTNGITSANMPENSWGVSTDNETFDKVMGLDDAVLVKTMDVANFASEWTQTLYFGVKVGASLPRGSYTKNVVFTAVASNDSFDFEGEAEDEPEQPELVTHYNRLIEASSMQDANLSQYCADTYTPTGSASIATFEATYYDDLVPRAVLTDIRDNKRYLISKLPDGSCWMTQNLDLVLSSVDALTNATTDLNTKSSWVPNHDTQTTAPVVTSSTSSSYYAKWPTDSTARSFRLPDDIYYVGGYTLSNKPTSYSDEYLWEKGGTAYNWFAATTSTSFSRTYDHTVTVSDSICPKGWKLPGYNDFDAMIKSVGTTDRANTIPFNENFQQQYKGYSNLEYDYNYSKLWSSTPGSALTIGSTTVGSTKMLNHSISDSAVAYVDDANQYGLAIRCKLR